jgi:pimeloyl-ACP methyl ester carboxylesterase
MSDSSKTGFLPVAGAELYYEVSGHGPAVVLLHAGIADLRMWHDQVPALADRYTVVRYDRRGFGRTQARPGSFSNRQDLIELLDHLQIGRAALVGSSMGGMIALDVTLERPERVSALVWVCSGIGGVMAPDEVFDPREIALFEQSEAAEEAGDWERAATLDVRIWVDGPLQPEGRAPEEVRSRVRAMSLANYTVAASEGLQPQPLDPPAAERLRDLTVPVLAVVGELDPAETAYSADVLATGAPDVRVIRYPDAAHLPNMEHPARFTGDLVAFLDALPPW